MLRVRPIAALGSAAAVAYVARPLYLFLMEHFCLWCSRCNGLVLHRRALLRLSRCMRQPTTSEPWLRRFPSSRTTPSATPRLSEPVWRCHGRTRRPASRTRWIIGGKCGVPKVFGSATPWRASGSCRSRRSSMAVRHPTARWSINPCLGCVAGPFVSGKQRRCACEAWPCVSVHRPQRTWLGG